jgi:hypothetical protein
MKLAIQFILFVFLNLFTPASGKTEEVLQKWESLIEQSRDLPIDEMVEALRGPLVGLGEIGDVAGVNHRSPRDQEVYEKVQTLLISKPGHAEYIEKKIREVMEIHKNYPVRARAALWYAHSLTHLPSVETVKVSMKLLDEIEPFTGKLDEQMFESIGRLGAYALREVLNDPPDFRTSDKVGWLEWRERIEAGEEFSFKERPGRFTLDGPVIVKKRDDGRLANGSKGGEAANRADGNEISGTPASDDEFQVPNWVYGLALSLVAWSLLRYLRRKSERISQHHS